MTNDHPNLTLTQKFIFFLIRQRLKMNRGMAWVSYFLAPVSAAVGVLVGSLGGGFILGVLATSLTITGFMLVGWILGHLEKEKLGSWQYENNIVVGELNPYFVQRFDQIDAELKELKRALEKQEQVEELSE